MLAGDLVTRGALAGRAPTVSVNCTQVHERMPAEERLRLGKLHSRFSLVKVKVLLVSLLAALGKERRRAGREGCCEQVSLLDRL